MVEPWNLRSDDTREVDNLPTFIIFCEDEVSEPIYFKYFETSKIKINTIVKQKNRIDHVINAIAHCLSKNLMEYKEGEPQIIQEGLQIWCVFDRDNEGNAIRQLDNNTSFNEAIDTAIKRGMKVAWSNDAFELWILIHFEDIDHTNVEYFHRKKYYDHLTSIFKKHPNPNVDLKKALSHSSFNYKQDLKKETNFRNIVKPEIFPKTKIAIERAKKLEQLHLSLVKPYHEMTPCTMVHHLVEELIKTGGREV